MAQQPQQRRASTAMLTFPMLSAKEALDFLNLPFLGLNVSANDLSNPSPLLVTRVYNALVDFVTDVPRSEVSDFLQQALQKLEHPDIFREALIQLTLQREMESLCTAALLQEASIQRIEFRLDDLSNPKANRFLTILSAIYNYALFRDDVRGRHAEQTEGLAKLEKELEAVKQCETELKSKIKAENERLAEEEPERRRLLDDLEREESAVLSLSKEKAQIEKAIEEEKKRSREAKSKGDAAVLEIGKIEKDITDIKSQLISSPEKIQENLEKLRARVDHETASVQNAKHDQARTELQIEELTSLVTDLDDIVTKISTVEAKAEEAHKEEEIARQRKIAIETHEYRTKELRQREQEAARAIKSAEEMQAQVQAQKSAQLKHARDMLRGIRRDLENRDRLASEESRKAAELRSEIATVKKQMERERVEHEKKRLQRNAELKRLLTLVDSYTEGIMTSVNALEEASAISSVAT